MSPVLSLQNWTELPKGGIAVAIQSELDIPVKYIGVGETIDDLQKFDADAFVNALFDVDHKENPQIRMSSRSQTRRNRKNAYIREFEEASEIVKQVTQETKLINSRLFQ